jgi:DNA-binding MarR family transcriptional regulator
MRSKVAAKKQEARAPTVPFATTLHVRDHCLCLAAQRAARALARRFDEVLRPHGITSGQFSLLMSLNRPMPPSIGSVASLLAMDRTTLTANLKPLERQGFLTLAVDPQDGRGRLIKLTRAGEKILKAAVPIWTRTHAEVEQPLARGELKTLRRGLSALA